MKANAPEKIYLYPSDRACEEYEDEWGDKPWGEDYVEYTRTDAFIMKAEDIVVTAKTFLDALSKTPYNNKPITDAQIIVKQLLLFFENPKEYNPDAILEQPEVDLEKEVKDILNQYYYFPEEPIDIPTVIRITAKHFYELGLKAMKGE